MSTLIRKKSSFLLTFFLAFFAQPALAVNNDELQKQAKIFQEEARLVLSQVEHIIKFNYAYQEFKKEKFGWDFKEDLAKTSRQILSGEISSPKEFRKSMYEFSRRARDLHFKFNFSQKATVKLPFRIRSVNGKNGKSYNVLAVEDEWKEKILAGSEVVKIDGEPVEDIVQKLAVVTSVELMPVESTTAEMLLTSRWARAGEPLPSSKIAKIELKHPTSGQLLPEISVPWQTIDESFVDHPIFRSENKALNISPRSVKNYSLRSRRGFVPLLGNILYRAPENDSYDGYVFQHAGQSFGYLRIGTFFPKRNSSVEAQRAVLQVLNFILKMEKTTDAMIIDLTNNDGGFKLFSYAIAKFLTVKSLKSVKERTVLTDRDMKAANITLDLAQLITDKASKFRLFPPNLGLGYPIDDKFIDARIKEAQFYVDRYNEGVFFPEVHYSEGVDEISPGRGRSGEKNGYSKPILLLTNSMSYSVTEEFTVLLKDNGRAKTFGSKTGGVSGKTRIVEFPNSLGFESLQVTTSQPVRIKDGSIIENSGVEVDYPYEPSVEDFKNGFQNYKSEVLKSLLDMIGS